MLTRRNPKNAQGILDQVKANVKTVESASAGAKEALSSTSLDIATICPNYVDYADLGVDLPDLSAIVGRERDNLQTAITTNVTMINETLSSIQATLDRIQTAVERTDDNLWVFPAVLLVAFVTTIVALVAAILSWTGKGSTRFEKRFAYGVLPFVVVVAVVCWIIATGAAISTLISSGTFAGFKCIKFPFPFTDDEFYLELLFRRLRWKSRCNCPGYPGEVQRRHEFYQCTVDLSLYKRTSVGIMTIVSP